MEEEHGGYVPIEHSETEWLVSPHEIEEEEVKSNWDLYRIDDEGWAKAPNGLVFGVFPKDLVDATQSINHFNTRVTALGEMDDLLKNESNFYHVLKYSSLFLKFLCTLLSDSSRDIIFAAHDLLWRIIAIPGFNAKANYSELLRVICDKNYSSEDPNVRLEG